MGMTHQWCGQYDFCDKMPADLAKTYDANLPKYMVEVGKWKGVRYGIPIEHGNFQQMYINVDMFKKAGPQSGRSAQDLRQMAGGPEEADDRRPEGRRAHASGFRDPQQGRSRWNHRQVPAVCARLGRPDAEP
jgi:ABC-type glycerol-3-phosphate transport system substrate-binding protein